ncbi:MAG: DNA polymerase III subunit gamma/tau [Clostridia bacterium]|nr:DNA polymerase III subunit gamma/tau [Clostridia bacterium]
MYRVLYRKWRPATFVDVMGQDHITTTLKNEITSNHLAHAYLFTGSRGTGKTTCAKIFARAVNCLNPVDGNPCCECEICKGIENGSILDVEEIDAASNNSVQNIRELRDMINYKPAAGKFRVYIIDEVHMLSSGAFNALLKTLEEPPAHVIFILATTEVHKLPATILSRCQRFDFNRIDSEVIASRLKYVASEENMNLDADAASLIARLADGALRDALSLLDRCAVEEHITMESVMKIAGVLGNDLLFEISDGVAKGEIEKVLATLADFHEQSKEMNRVCDQLISHFRNIMICKTVSNPARLLTCSKDELLKYMNAAATFSLEDILKTTDNLQSALERMKYSASKRAELEMALIRSMPSMKSVLKRTVEKDVPVIEESVSAPVLSTPAKEEKKETPIVEEKVENIPVKEAPDLEKVPEIKEEKPVQKVMPESTGNIQEGEQPFGAWPDVVAELSSYNRLIAAALKGTEAFIDGNLVLIKCENKEFLDMINQNPNNKADIRKAIQNVTGMTCRLGPYRPQNTEQKTDPLSGFLSNMQSKGILNEISNEDE